MRLTLDYYDIYTQVAKEAGFSRSPVGEDRITVKELINRAYRKFIYPVGGYTWSFLKQQASLITSAGQRVYSLSPYFTAMSKSFKFESGEGYANPININESLIMDKYSMNNTSGYPEYYAVKAAKFDIDVEHTYEVVFWPEPDSNYKYVYKFIAEPCAPELYYQTITGSIDPSPTSTTVVGIGTAFTTELRKGDKLLVGSEVRNVIDITDDTNLTVDEVFFDDDEDTSPERIRVKGNLIGGAAAHECLLQLCLAEVENQLEEKIGSQTQLSRELLTGLVSSDMRNSPDTVGLNNDPGTIIDNTKNEVRLHDINYVLD